MTKSAAPGSTSRKSGSAKKAPAKKAAARKQAPARKAPAKKPAKKAPAKKAAARIAGPVELAVTADLENRPSAHPMAGSLRAIAIALAARMDNPSAASTLDKAAGRLADVLDTLAEATPPDDDPVVDDLSTPELVPTAEGHEAPA